MKALLALAAIAVAVIALRPRRPAPLPESDDIVGMPTTHVHLREVPGSSWTISPEELATIARLWRPYEELPKTRKN